MTGGLAHILYVITDLALGGVPLHLHRLIREVRKQGIRATVVSLAPAGAVASMLEAQGASVVGCAGRNGWDVRVIPRLGRIIRDVQPDLIHSLLFHANVAVRLAGRWVGYPPERILCEIQTVEVERRWHLSVDRWTNRWCALTIGNSPSVIEHLAMAGRIAPERLQLIRGGIDPQPIQAAAPADRGSLGVPSDAKIVLWAGRLDRVKGVDVLLRAFARLDAGLSAHLVLAGDGPLRASLFRDAARLGLTDRIHWLGARRDVPALLRTADVFAFPSRTEGLPNALLEAMAAGCPIVTTNVAGCRDLIQNEINGLLVPWGSADGLAGALRRLLTDRPLAVRLGAQAHATVTTHWHSSAMWAAYLELYRARARGSAPAAG